MLSVSMSDTLSNWQVDQMLKQSALWTGEVIGNVEWMLEVIGTAEWILEVIGTVEWEFSIVRKTLYSGSVGKSIRPVFRRPRFESWLNSNFQ